MRCNTLSQIEPVISAPHPPLGDAVEATGTLLTACWLSPRSEAGNSSSRSSWMTCIASDPSFSSRSISAVCAHTAGTMYLRRAST